MSNDETAALDFTHVEHPRSSNAVYDGIETEVDGWPMKLRPIGTRNRFSNAYRAKHNIAPEDSAAGDKHMVPYLVECVVMDWTPIRLSSGTEVPYSPANARRLFEAHPGIAMAVFQKAVNLAIDLERAVEAEAQALGNSPAGGLNGASTSSSSPASPAPAATSPH